MFAAEETRQHSNTPKESQTRERPKTCKFLPFSVLEFERKTLSLLRCHRMNVENPGELTQRTFCSPFKGYIIPRMNVDGDFLKQVLKMTAWIRHSWKLG
jgi:hypothetical protein